MKTKVIQLDKPKREWIDETKQPFKLISMPDQRGFYFYV